MVLPVPLSPANSALMPRPRAPFRGEAPARRRPRGGAARARRSGASVDFCGSGSTRSSQRRGRLDALRQVVEPAAHRGRGRPATAPHPASATSRERRAQRCRAVRGDRLRRSAGTGWRRRRAHRSGATPSAPSACAHRRCCSAAPGLSTAKRRAGRSMTTGSRAPMKTRPPACSASRVAAARSLRRRRIRRAARCRAARPRAATASPAHRARAGSAGMSAARRTMQLQAEPPAIAHGHVSLAGGIVAHKLHHRRQRPSSLERLNARHRRRCAWLVGHGGRRRMQAQQRAQARVEIVHAGEEVQHALVDAQPAAWPAPARP